MADPDTLGVSKDDLEVIAADLGLETQNYYNTGIITAIDQEFLGIQDGVIRSGFAFTSSNTYQSYVLGAEYTPGADGSLGINLTTAQREYNPDEIPLDGARIDVEIEDWKAYRQENPLNTPDDALNRGYVLIDNNLSPIERAMHEAGILPHGHSSFFQNELIAKDDIFRVEREGGVTELSSITLLPGEDGVARQAIGITNTFNQEAGVVSSQVSLYALDQQGNLVVAHAPENVRDQPFGRAADIAEAREHEVGARQRFYEP
ncbi:MAG: hypothetical protein AAF569_03310 [Pseudomonadota bacterium]